MVQPLGSIGNIRISDYMYKQGFIITLFIDETRQVGEFSDWLKDWNLHPDLYGRQDGQIIFKVWSGNKGNLIAALLHWYSNTVDELNRQGIIPAAVDQSRESVLPT